MKELSFVDKLNAKLSRVRVREKNGYLYLRGQFPDGDNFTRKEIALKIKAEKSNFTIALGKAQEIDAQLMLDKWELKQKEKLTVGKAIKEFEKNHWIKFEPTPDRLLSWERNQMTYFKELPEDEIFNQSFLLKAVTSFPSGSYKQSKFCELIRPVARFHNINFDFASYMNYSPPKTNLRKLPTDEIIVDVFEKENFLPHKWALGILATFGLRPHEFFRSEFDFTAEVPVVYVGRKTKKKIERTVYAIPIKGLNYLKIPNQWEWFEQSTNLQRTNIELGHNVTNWFRKYPFTSYQLRHYYAVRGAMYGLSPVFVSSWMGHSLTVHYKHYGSLLGDNESAKLWKETFTGS